MQACVRVRVRVRVVLRVESCPMVCAQGTSTRFQYGWTAPKLAGAGGPIITLPPGHTISSERQLTLAVASCTAGTKCFVERSR